jgi:hypothetical protein
LGSTVTKKGGADEDVKIRIKEGKWGLYPIISYLEK